MEKLSKNNDILNGYVMLENEKVVIIENGKITEINHKLAPLHFQKGKSLEEWLKSRAIDSHRTNSRLLKKALRLENKDDLNTVLAVNAVTITDNYWYKGKDENLTWEEVKFKENIFDNLALKGDPDAFLNNPSRTPELTNIGSFEKCWKLENNKWWLYKYGNQNQIFSELFIYNIGKKLGFNMAKYEFCDGYIKSLDFTNNRQYNYEPISSVLNDNEDYNTNFEYFYSLSEEIAKEYLKMIYLDSICYNMDRHTNNYGLLRNAKTGEILSLAPNFDNNIALISNGYPSDVTRKKDGLMKFFIDFIKQNEKARSMLKSLNIKILEPEEIEQILENIPIEVNKDFIIDFIINGQNIIKGDEEKC